MKNSDLHLCSRLKLFNSLRDIPHEMVHAGLEVIASQHHTTGHKENYFIACYTCMNVTHIRVLTAKRRFPINF